MFIKTNIVKIFFWIETPDILKTNTKQIYVYISLLINMAYTEKILLKYLSKNLIRHKFENNFIEHQNTCVGNYNVQYWYKKFWYSNNISVLYNHFDGPTKFIFRSN